MGPRSIPDGDNKKVVYRVNHWFDCLSQVHRFQIHAPTADQPHVRVTHSSRLTCDNFIERIQKSGARDEFTFGAKRDLCQSLFQKALSVFRASPATGQSPSDMNIGVSLSVNFPGLSSTAKSHDKPLDTFTLTNKSDMTFMQALDPETLEPRGVAAQKVLHPDLKGPISAAHASVDPVTGDFYNFNIEVGAKGATYRAFTTSASTGKTTILATIKHAPAYLHSTYLTENFFVLCIWNSFFSAGGASILWNRNYVDALSDWDASKPATWYAIGRTEATKGLIATYKGDPYFAFHSINAFEEPNADDATQTDLVLDVVAYDNLDVIKRFYIDNVLSDSATARDYADTSTRGAFRRFRLPKVPRASNAKPLRAVTEFSGDKGLAPELPVINGALVATKRYRYVYGVTDSGKSTFLDGLVKFDPQEKSYLLWNEPAQTPGEPIFVADPARPDQEDGGVLLSVVLDGVEGKSYLLVLDAETLKEVGRAKVDGVVGFGFHGIHVTDALMAGSGNGKSNAKL